MRLEQALRANEKRRPVVAMPARVAAGRNLGVEYAHLGLRIPRKRAVDGVEQYVAPVLFARFEKAVELQLQVLVFVEHVSCSLYPLAAERDPIRAARGPSCHALLDGDTNHVHSYAH